MQIVSKMQLKESALQLAPCNIPTCYAMVESTVDGGVLIGLGTKKRWRRKLHLALTIAAAKEFDNFNGRKGALWKKKMMSNMVMVGGLEFQIHVGR